MTAPSPPETARMPGLGQTVHYTLTAVDAKFVTDVRARSEAAAMAGPALGAILHGADVAEGDTYPATVVRVHSIDPDSPVSLQVHLDGCDLYWAPLRHEGTGPGTWSWPDA